MPLTPEDVRNKRFTPVRLREGYDMGEVDQFLDEVEAELERLTVENEELRSKVAAASSGEATGLVAAPISSPATTTQEYQSAPAWEPEADSEHRATPESPAASDVPAPEPSDTLSAGGPDQADESVVSETPAPDTSDLEAAKESSRASSIGEASAAAARLLEIASNNADELMEQAKEEADRVVGEAQAKADRILNEARGKADRVETDSRIRAQKLDDETNERREQALGAIERERTELQRDVEHLRAYEREYRARLKNYFQTQLEGLEAQDQSHDDSAADSSPAPRRIRTDDEI